MAAASFDVEQFRVVVQGLASDSEEVRDSSIRDIVKCGVPPGTVQWNEMRRLLSAHPGAFRTLLEALCRSPELATPAACLLVTLCRNNMPARDENGRWWSVESMDPKWLAEQALAAAGSLDSLLAMVPPSLLIDGAAPAPSAVVGIITGLLMEGLGARQSLLTNHCGLVHQCVRASLAGLRTARPSLDHIGGSTISASKFVVDFYNCHKEIPPQTEDPFGERFLDTLFDDSSPEQPPATLWTPVLSWTFDAMLTGDSIGSAAFKRAVWLHQLIIEAVETGRKTRVEGGVETDVLSLLRQVYDCHVDRIMDILTGDGETYNLQWRASICVILIVPCVVGRDCAKWERSPDVLAFVSLPGGPCERLLAEPGALKTVADSIKRALTDIRDMALMTESLDLPHALICAGHGCEVVRAGFPEMLAAMMRNPKWMESPGRAAGTIVCLHSLLVYGHSKIVLPVIMGLGMVEMLCDALYQHRQNARVRLLFGGMVVQFGLIREGEHRVGANAPHNKISQRILQSPSIKKLRALPRDDQTDKQDTGKRPKSKKGKNKGPSQSSSPPGAAPHAYKCPPSQEEVGSIIGLHPRDLEASTLPGVLTLLDRIEKKEDERAAAVLDELIAADETAEKDKSKQVKGRGKGKKGKGAPNAATHADSSDKTVTRVSASAPEAAADGHDGFIVVTTRKRKGKGKPNQQQQDDTPRDGPLGGTAMPPKPIGSIRRLHGLSTSSSTRPSSSSQSSVSIDDQAALRRPQPPQHIRPNTRLTGLKDELGQAAAEKERLERRYASVLGSHCEALDREKALREDIRRLKETITNVRIYAGSRKASPTIWTEIPCYP
ncbi:unnamed protein product [Vitrella brassicaformis CCMP3155]|uniref:Uncharacterized protein n=1 Tax=Vitrella brassicaformis (strain CCMP3155) TaxID=1169540 RepID=A0A0G4EV63_VITBC|nr:unnamed protein product [Vitrella brassicaformis CCMP3155]|eukprot:CEM02506.1 unnamed protein product [Vitrella brassicaformis CCMP3155]